MAESGRTVGDEMLREPLAAHVRRFFSAEAAAAFDSLDIRFVSYDSACALRARVVAVPVDDASHSGLDDSWHVPFNGTRLTVWHRLPAPSGDGWTAVPGPESPLWYVHESGTFIPAWDLARLIGGLLRLDEENATARDKHGRFPAHASPRSSAGLLEVPAFNEAAAALVAVAMAEAPEDAVRLPAGAIRPPTLALSHDVDVLMGNDPWAQLMRFGGVLAPLAKFRAPSTTYMRLIAENHRDPRHYYLNDVDRMVRAERKHGFRSAFYFLLGKRGLYGPRYTASAVREALQAIPAGWVRGIHYGYYSHLQEDSFAHEVAELTGLLGHAPKSGRAHYLRHDPVRSPAFVARFGVALDESLGYPDAVGYRAGIAGPYRVPGVLLPDGSPMLEMPLAIMDGPLLDYPDPLGTFERMLRHLTFVGGALSVLTHPGTMDNPQREKARGLYESMLELAAGMGVAGMPAQDFLEGDCEAS